MADSPLKNNPRATSRLRRVQSGVTGETMAELQERLRKQRLEEAEEKTDKKSWYQNIIDWFTG